MLKVPFLLDTGADRTAFSANILAILPLKPIVSPYRLGGVGGEVASVNVETQIRLTNGAGAKVTFNGRFAGFTMLEALDMSVLGRDVTNFFAAIVDRPGAVVCLLGQRHQYIIVQP